MLIKVILDKFEKLMLTLSQHPKPPFSSCAPSARNLQMFYVSSSFWSMITVR